MNVQNNKSNFFLVISIIGIGSLSRLIPHLPNFTPVAAMALLGGAYITNKRMAVLFPVLIMIVSDVLLELFLGIGFHNTMLYVYLSFVLTSIIGVYISKQLTTSKIIIASLASSILFFIITNFGYWASNNFYGGLSGLNASYIAAIPFFRNSILGDLFYNALFFISYNFAFNKFFKLAK